MAIEFLALYSAKCKRCGHLDPEEEKKFNKCHFKKGNLECPAKEVQIVVVGEAKRFAAEVRKARAARNIDREIKVLDEVAKRSPAFQQKFREWLST